jgi:septum formation protein
MRHQRFLINITQVVVTITITSVQFVTFTQSFNPFFTFQSTARVIVPVRVPVNNNNNIIHSHSRKLIIRMNSNNKVETDNGTGNFLLSNLDQLSISGPRRLILASQSPRRREILDMMGLKEKYTVNPSPLDEGKLQLKLSKMEMTPEEYTKTLAEEKANALAEQLVSSIENADVNSGAHDSVENADVTFILGSDTIVDLNGKILEKPISHENAVEMLKELSNSWHAVHTGVALYRIDHHAKANTDTKSEPSIRMQLATSYTETSRVKFSDLSIKDIEAYVNTGEPMDKAGSYGIQVCFSFISFYFMFQ